MGGALNFSQINILVILLYVPPEKCFKLFQIIRRMNCRGINENSVCLLEVWTRAKQELYSYKRLHSRSLAQ